MENILLEMDIRHNRASTLNLTIVEQELMLKGDLDIGLIPSTIPLITKVNVLNF